MQAPASRKWRRLDEPGLERLQIVPEHGGVRAVSTLVHAGADPFGLTYDWRLDEQGRTRSLELHLQHLQRRSMFIERMAHGWHIDGEPRADLAACEEIDLSATPLCNSLAIQRLNGTGEITALYVDLPSLETLASRQRYERLAESRWRYIDLGIAEGFEAEIEFASDGLVDRYEGLFEAI